MFREGKRCVIYVRVSTEMQVDGFSLDGQRNVLKKYAEREGMEVINTYEDAGKSGKNIEGRPAFKKMMLDIENGLAIDYILVYKLSRFGRNAADILTSLELLQTYDVNLISTEEGIDSSQTSGKLLISVLSAVSEIERENILEQTMNGRREKARQGGWNGGFAPYGYDLVDGRLVIAEDEVEPIKLIFEMYAKDNYGIEKIAKELNLKEIKKKKRQNGQLELWSRSTIKNILDNPVYAGKIAYGRRSNEKIKGTRNEYKRVYKNEYILEEGQHEPIITEELWNLTYDKRSKAAKNKSIIGVERVHFMSGILKCPRCGGPMYASKYYNKNKKGIYKEYYFYECSHHKSQRGHPCDCNLKIMKPKIEPYVIELIRRSINCEEFINAVESHISDNTDIAKLEAEKTSYEAKLLELKENKARIEKALDNMPLDVKHREKKIADYEKRLDVLYDQIDDIEIRINGVTVQLASADLGRITKEDIIEGIKNFGALYDAMNDEEKKRAITGIIKKIEINETPVGNNYIKSIDMIINPSDRNAIEATVPGDILNGIEDLSLDYQENTYMEMETDKEYCKHKKNYYVKKNRITYKMIKDYVMEHYGFKVHTQYIAEVKKKNGVEMQCDRTINGSKYPCPPEKVVAIEDALKYFELLK